MPMLMIDLLQCVFVKSHAILIVHVALPLGGSVYGHLILLPCSSIEKSVSSIHINK
jgi:hypothetical protein